MSSYKQIPLQKLTSLLENDPHYSPDPERHGEYLIKKDTKWNLIIDTTTRASIFLQYRNTNLIDVLQSKSMEPKTLLNTLLASVNFGKELIFNLETNERLIEKVEESFEAIEKGLFDKLINKKFDRLYDLSSDLLNLQDPEKYPADGDKDGKSENRYKWINDQMKDYQGFKIIFIIKKDDGLEDFVKKYGLEAVKIVL